MEIKVEKTKDFRKLAKLNETVQNWHHANYPDNFKPFDQIEIERAFGKMMQNEDVCAFMATHQGESIGYLIGYNETRPESAFQYEKAIFYIDQIAVVQEFQKRGVGQLLLKNVYKLVKEKQVKEIQLDFWAGNQRAERFFLREGFDYFNHKMKK